MDTVRSGDVPSSPPAGSAPLSPRIVYSPRYNIGLFGLERLHPFDSRKFGRAWRLLRSRFGRTLTQAWVRPPRPVNETELLRLHTEQYLGKLRDPAFVAGILEIPQLRRLPRWMLDRLVLRAMRWATMGTTIAVREAMEHGLAVNLAGGYHHASPDYGHGFSVYADIGLAIHELRRTGRLAERDKIVYVDLDAHQGNGVCRTFVNDNRVFIYDQYNAMNFPFDQRAQRRIDCDVQLAPGCHEVDYLGWLRSKLPPFLDAVTRTGEVKLAIYNAGTDIYCGDRLGGCSSAIVSFWKS
jgi:histone deacetylase 11